VLVRDGEARQASRNESSESYVIAQGFKGAPAEARGAGVLIENWRAMSEGGRSALSLQWRQLGRKQDVPI